MKINAILFDKDGTLFDFNATWGAWTRGLLEGESGGDTVLMAALADVLGYDLRTGLFRPDSIVIAHTASDVADVILPLLSPQSKADLISRMNAKAALAPQAEAAPLIPFLSGLVARGLRLGVATNDAEAPARAHLDAAGISEKFDFIAGFDSGFGAKPAAGQLLAFCDHTGLPPTQCAMVGDSLHDLHAGRAAGMVTVGVLTGLATRAELAPSADIVMGSIADIPAWLDSSRA